MWDERVNETFRIVQEGMDVAVARRRLIASNLANAETPGYKAADIDFERYLREAQGPAKIVVPVRMIMTHPGHFGPMATTPHLPLKRSAGLMGEMRADGNTVDMEGEMAKMAQNQIRFQALTEALNRVLALLEQAVTEGGRR